MEKELSIEHQEVVIELSSQEIDEFEYLGQQEQTYCDIESELFGGVL